MFRFLNVPLTTMFLLAAACTAGGEDDDWMEEAPGDGGAGTGTALAESRGRARDRAPEGMLSSIDARKPADTPPNVSDAAPSRVVGAWVSPSCGARTYARQFNFASDGSFQAQDLISPCPEGVACFWSGIVENRGKYEERGATIALDIQEPSTVSLMAPFPTSLAIDAATSAPVEFTPEGARCVYKPARRRAR